MMRLALLPSASLLFLAASVPADAADADAVARKVQACWSVPAGAGTLEPVTVDAQIGPDGVVEEAAAAGEGVSPEDHALAASAVRAVRRCGPYPELPAGAVRFRLMPGEAADPT